MAASSGTGRPAEALSSQAASAWDHAASWVEEQRWGRLCSSQASTGAHRPGSPKVLSARSSKGGWTCTQLALSADVPWWQQCYSSGTCGWSGKQVRTRQHLCTLGGQAADLCVILGLHKAGLDVAAEPHVCHKVQQGSLLSWQVDHPARVGIWLLLGPHSLSQQQGTKQRLTSHAVKHPGRPPAPAVSPAAARAAPA